MLQVDDLTLEYVTGGYRVRPVDGLSFEAQDGSLVVLLGASGCGKTTLLSALASLLRPLQGTIRLGDLDVTALSGAALTEYRRRGVGLVFQAFNLLPGMSALDNVAVPMWNVGASGREARARARELLTQLGLGDRLDHRPDALSGGQQQRVAVARALVMRPPLLLADEPTAHLDEAQVEGVLHLLRQAAAPGRVVVVATHDERLLPLADKVIELSPRLRPLVTAPTVVTLAPGEVLFREGEAGDVAYVVESGSVELVRMRADGTEEVVVTAGPGRWFGELAPLLGLRRSATARATEPTTLTACSPADLRAVVARQQTTAPASTPA
jgi:putative ABC transport system ATP-binding protein